MTARIIGGRSCRTCEFSRQENSVVFCLRYPPQVTAVVLPAPNGQGVGVRVDSNYPPVNPDWPCGEYRRSEARAMDEISGPPVGGVT